MATKTVQDLLLTREGVCDAGSHAALANVFDVGKQVPGEVDRIPAFLKKLCFSSADVPGLYTTKYQISYQPY